MAARKLAFERGELKKSTNKNAALLSGVFVNMERETRLELATPTLARSCSTN
ncbi:hypothetical protein ALO95_200208 [Pseudomonas syringae pv. antirrhini]|nr:hypothetical protein ALO95_200208 [Pseudomonas syringae pv. antirrhini]